MMIVVILLTPTDAALLLRRHTPLVLVYIEVRLLYIVQGRGDPTHEFLVATIILWCRRHRRCLVLLDDCWLQVIRLLQLRLMKMTDQVWSILLEVEIAVCININIILLLLMWSQSTRKSRVVVIGSCNWRSTLLVCQDFPIYVSYSRGLF